MRRSEIPSLDDLRGLDDLDATRLESRLLDRRQGSHCDIKSQATDNIGHHDHASEDDGPFNAAGERFRNYFRANA